MTKRTDPLAGLRRPSSTIIPRFLWGHDAHQNEALHALSDQANLLHRRSERVHQDLAERMQSLEDEVGRLLLVNHALVQELTRLKVIESPVLEAAMKSLDLADGVEDGQVTRARPKTAVKSAPKSRKRPTP